MTTATPESNAIECGGIALDDRFLMDIENGQVMVSVDRREIRQISIRYGFQAAHPVLQIVAGLLLTGVGYFSLAHLVRWMRYGGVFIEYELGFLVFGALGVWLLVSAFRSGYVLLVRTPHGTKRLLFKTVVDSSALNAFVTSLEQQCGVRIER